MLRHLPQPGTITVLPGGKPSRWSRALSLLSVGHGCPVPRLITMVGSVPTFQD